jgi:hypothetical protein
MLSVILNLFQDLAVYPQTLISTAVSRLGPQATFFCATTHREATESRHHAAHDPPIGHLVVVAALRAVPPSYGPTNPHRS